MNYYFEVDRNYYRKIYEKETSAMNLYDKEVYLFKKYLENIPMYIEDGDMFAGWYGYTEIPQDIKLHNELKQRAETDEENYLLSINEPYAVMKQKYNYRCFGYDRGHTLMDFEGMIRRGTRSYLKEVEEKVLTVNTNSKEGQYLSAMKKALEYGEIFSLRFAELAGELAKKANNESDKARLLKIEKMCRKVPMEPAEDFYEAIQAAFLLYSLICISDDSWVSISFGSFDQYMYPYYVKSKELGVSDGEIESLLLEFFRKLDLYGGIDCALSVGGVDAYGNDLTNDLSYAIVDAEKKSLKRAPLFSVRVNPNTPDKLMNEVICSKLFEIGQPTFYSEYGCRNAVMGRGISEEEASKYQISTCMQMEFAGAQVNASWGLVLNLHLPLELALNNGEAICGKLPFELKTKPRADYKNIEEVYAQYELYLRELFDFMCKRHFKDLNEKRLNEPNPWLSALTADCIEKGADRWDGGAKYHDITVENFGFANAADALGAVEKLVIKEKKYDVSQLINAAAQNYEGYEDIRADIMKCDKYGMNIEEADERARRILAIVIKICEEKRKDNIRFLPSLHTLDLDVEFARFVPAMLDGRLYGESFNKNAGPANSARSAGPTAMVLSACRLDQKKLSGGQALDVHFAVRNMDSPDKRQKLASFIKTYLFSGGLQMQVNALSSATLKKAYAEPEKYKDLIVRIGGHSRYYNDLPDDVKREFIHRISIEEGSAI